MLWGLTVPLSKLALEWLAGPWLAYNSVLLGSPSIEPRLREL